MSNSDENNTLSSQVTTAELEELIPYCPCRLCKQTWLQYIVGFFLHGNCSTCHGCLKAGEPMFVNPKYVKEARLVRNRPSNYSPSDSSTPQ